MSNFIQTLPVNEKGRDFVVGDLHGQITILNDALGAIGFDPRVDRLISVGDLIDRGENSSACLELVSNSWFHFVKGNHEQLMEDFLTGGPTGLWWFRNGGSWWSDAVRTLHEDDQKDIIDTLQTAPWLITVPMVNGKKFHVVHAELPLGVLTDTLLEDEEFVRKICLEIDGDGPRAIWGRNLWAPICWANIDTSTIRRFRKTLLWVRQKMDFLDNEDLSFIFSGHTILQKPCIFEKRVNIDTGAFLVGQREWAGLIMVEPLTGKFWKTNNEGTKEVEPVEL
jgi:hypothetical protein